MKLTRCGKVALLCLCLSTATVGWWAHSRTSVDTVRAGSYDLWAGDGRVSIVKSPTATDATVSFALSSRPTGHSRDLPLFDYNPAGYDQAARKWKPASVIFPIWALTAAFALPPVLWAGLRRNPKGEKPAH